MPHALNVYAGAGALTHLKQQGLQQAAVDWLIGASGGPKWFVLFGLDEYIFGEFFKHRERPLNTLGSSAGSWRMSCFARLDPVAAIRRLGEGYSQICYPKDADIDAISAKSVELIDYIHGSQGEAEITQHAWVRNHIITARCKGWLGADSKLKQSVSLLGAALANVASRRTLGWHCERVVFHAGHSSALPALTDLPTTQVPLSQDNVRQALLASGAIPLVINGERDIAGAPPGMYRDGGTVDYHLDLPLQHNGLVLYPHFYPYARPGWFDKSLSWRHASKAHFDKVIMLVPSPEFVASLPYGKIPDRKDFNNLDDKTRIAYFRQVMAQSRQLADELHELITQNNWAERVQPLPW